MVEEKLYIPVDIRLPGNIHRLLSEEAAKRGMSLEKIIYLLLYDWYEDTKPYFS